MKKFTAVGLAFMLATAVIFSAFPFLAAAETELIPLPAELEIYRGADENGSFEALLENEETFAGETTVETRAVEFAAAAGEDGSLYSMLTTRQKACYDALREISIDSLLTASQVEYNNKTYRRMLAQVKGISGVSMQGTVVGGKFVPAAGSASVESDIYTDLCAAIVAVRYDHPEMLWMSSMRYGYKTQQTSNGVVIADVLFDFNLEYKGEEKTMCEKMLANAEVIAAEAATASDTYSRVKLVHDALIKNNTYGNVNDALSHTAYSALVEDEHSPVCDGYAKAFKIICDMLEIPCVTASSKDHMWNNVRMDDGEWYNVDLTWDDDDAEEVKLDYFLIGSQTEINGEVFSKQSDHTELNPFAPYYESDTSGIIQPVELGFPAKCKKAYEYIGGDYPPLTFADVKRSAWYFSAVEEASQLGLFTGDEKGLFQPNDKITRAQFALVMANSLGVDLSVYTESPFKDVPAGRWYTAAAAWAKESGVMSGYTDGSFKPNAPITRQEMCVVLYNAMTEKPELSGFAFADDARIGGWAREAVYACQAAGLVQGDNKGEFAPTGSTLRSHAAVVFAKFAGLTQPAI